MICSIKIQSDLVMLMKIRICLFSSSLNIVILFAVLGIYMGIYDGSQKSYISEISIHHTKQLRLGL